MKHDSFNRYLMPFENAMN